MGGLLRKRELIRYASLLSLIYFWIFLFGVMLNLRISLQNYAIIIVCLSKFIKTKCFIFSFLEDKHLLSKGILHSYFFDRNDFCL